MIHPSLLYYASAGLTIALSGLGTGIGLGIAGAEIMKQGTRQALAQEPLFRKILLIGGAIIESGAIISLVASLLVVTQQPDIITIERALALSGSLLAVGITSCIVGLASSLIVKTAAQAIARVPLFTTKIVTFMLLTQAVMEAPVIFALIVHFMVKARISELLTITEASALCAVGICIAIGSIGPSIGQLLLAQASMHGIGTNYHAYNKIAPFTFLNQAFIETPVVFCLLIIGLIVQKAPLNADNPLFAHQAWIAISVISFSAITGAIAIGLVSRKSSIYIAKNPLAYAVILRTTMLTVAFIESCVVYALLVALFLIAR